MKTSNFEQQAKDVADRLAQARDLGEQLTFLPDPDGQGGQMVETPRKAGRPKGSKNKTESKLHAMLAARGYRMPQDVLAEIAGLSTRDDVFVAAMARTEQVLAWAGSQHPGEFQATVAQRLGTFADIFKMMVKAADSLLPYGLAKVTPDVTQNVQAVQIVMPGGNPGAQSAVISGTSNRDMRPPPMPVISEQKQEVSNSDNPQSDNESRTL